MDKSKRRADGNKGYGGIVGEIIEEDGQQGVEHCRDFIVKHDEPGGGGGREGGSVTDRRECRNNQS